MKSRETVIIIYRGLIKTFGTLLTLCFCRTLKATLLGTHVQILFLEFLENGQKKRKYPVSYSSVVENKIPCCSQRRWFKVIEMDNVTTKVNKNITDITLKQFGPAEKTFY